MSVYLKNLVDSMPRRLQDVIRRERATPSTTKGDVHTVSNFTAKIIEIKS
jgi:hypothetical protein